MACNGHTEQCCANKDLIFVVKSFDALISALIASMAAKLRGVLCLSAPGAGLGIGAGCGVGAGFGVGLCGDG